MKFVSGISDNNHALVHVLRNYRATADKRSRPDRQIGQYCCIYTDEGAASYSHAAREHRT